MNRKKRIALATVPAIALVLLGSSVASAHMGRFESLTEEQRTALDEARELRREGDSESAREVLKEAGLDPEMPRMHRMRADLSESGVEAMRAMHEGIHAAIEAHDFDAFKEATADAPFSDQVTEENFERLVKAHELRKAGDHEGAWALMREVGFPGHPRGPKPEGEKE